MPLPAQGAGQCHLVKKNAFVPEEQLMGRRQDKR
jgi:hypothetical protein